MATLVSVATYCANNSSFLGQTVADSLGIDISSTSLGYFTFDNPVFNYTYATHLNGNSTISAKGADFAAKIMELSSVEEPTSTEGGSADETTTIKTDDTVIDLRGDGSKPLLYIVGGTVVTPAEFQDMRSIEAW